MEQHHSTLQEAIERLPRYAPDASVWENITQQLNADAAEAPLQAAIEQLPTYAPPPEVWERIAHDLHAPPLVLRQLRATRVAWSAVAATLLLAIVSWVFWLRQPPDPQEIVQTSHTEAPAAPMPSPADWDEDEAIIEHIQQQYTQRAALFDLPAAEDLLSDLEELNEAKAEIKTMMQKYGHDTQLVRTIAQIERERSAIIKKMAQEI